MRMSIFLIVMLLICTVNSYAVQFVNMKIHVRGEKGKPVEGAVVKGIFFQDQVVNKQILSSHHGITNSDGAVELSGHEDIYVDLHVKKKGYYDSNKRLNVRDGRNRDVSILLRRKINPIGMYAKKIIGPPPGYVNKKTKQTIRVGYDLMVGDYVSPNGKGVISDMIIKTESTRRSWANLDLKRTITFSNKLDGLIPFYFKQKESDYRGPYVAPKFGYQNMLVQQISRRPGKKDQINIDYNRNYFIRIRTKANKEGKIISAYYGKIYGEFPGITYHLNPMAKDRNIEFSPESNLFRNLKPEEKALMP